MATARRLCEEMVGSEIVMKQSDRPTSKPEGDDGSPTIRERAWAVVRIILGLGQMIGAIVSVYFLIETGVNAMSLGAVTVTCMLTVTSRLLFRRKIDSKEP
jgi:hypothetical protein